jgi:hypothetical protein
MRIYISGPMSGIPSFNYPAFDAMAAKLRSFGHEVISPAEFDSPEETAAVLAAETGSPWELPPERTYGFYLGRAIQILVDSKIDAVFVLPRWIASTGARLETQAAACLGKLFFDHINDSGYLYQVPLYLLRDAWVGQGSPHAW